MNNNNNNSNNSNNNSNNSNNNSNNSNNNSVKTSAVDLEKLQMEYNSQLNEYKQAVANYVNYLQQNAETPCSNYSANTTGISQACYNNIWQKAGCGSGNVTVNASSSWASSQTLNGLINDSWLWATETDSYHRDGCYGPNNTKYNTTTAPDFNINAPPMTTIPGNTFWGSGQAGSQSVYTGGTLEQCQALCSSTTNCSGATFNPTAHGQPMCWLRSGEGQLAPGLDTDTAIIPQGQEYLLTINSINNKLIATNQQIQNIIDKSEPEYNSIQTKNEEKNQELIQNYVQLIDEREKIAKMIKKYEDLDESQIQGELKINQKYYTYILLVLVVIGTVVLLYKFSNLFTQGQSSETNVQTGGELSENTSVFLLIIIVVILIANYYTTIASTTTNIGNTTFNGIASIFSNITNFFSLSDNF